MSPGKNIPKIEFSPMIKNGVIHMVPVIEKRIMLGHRFSGDCCNPSLMKTPNGQSMVIHNVIH